MAEEDRMSDNRRPLATRSKAWAQKVARLVTSTGVSPNAISLASIAFACGTTALLVLGVQPDQPAGIRIGCALGAALTIQLRLLCNMLDGMVAVEGGMQSAVGELYNELPDRISDALTLVGLGYACASFPWGVELGYGAAILASWTAYVRALGGSVGAPQPFLGPMAKPHRMAAVTVALVLYAGEVAWGGPGVALMACLWLVITGSAVTVARRTSRVASWLRREGAG